MTLFRAFYWYTRGERVYFNTQPLSYTTQFSRREGPVRIAIPTANKSVIGRPFLHLFPSFFPIKPYLNTVSPGWVGPTPVDKAALLSEDNG